MSTKEDRKRVIEWFEKAKRNPANWDRVQINLWYDGNVKALKQLQKEEIIKNKYLGEVYVGMEYKEHLFVIEAGSGDCEELLICKGKI